MLRESLSFKEKENWLPWFYPDYEAIKVDNIQEEKLPQIMERNRMALNRQLARYEKISKIVISNTEFEKTSSKTSNATCINDCQG